MEQSKEYRDYYAALGLSPGVDQKEIGRAYRRLIKSIHPDASGRLIDPTVGRRVAELVEAWRVLGDRSRRAAYDRTRQARAGGGFAAAERDTPDQPPPRIELQPASLDIGRVKRGEVVNGYVSVFNRGGPAITLERLGEGPEWLSDTLPPNVDCTLHFPLTLTVRVDTACLTPRRRYQAEVAIRLSGWSPQSIDEAKLLVTVEVAAEEAPKLTARPAGWIIEPCECEGAPRSLVLHCSVSNEGDGILAGTLEAPQWIHVEPSHFGPLKDGDAPLRALVLVDRQVWQREGTPEGTLWISSKEGDGRKLTVMPKGNQETSSGGLRSRAVSWVAGAIATLAVGPALVMIADLPLAMWAILLIACLALPTLLDRLRRWNLINMGSIEAAPGWESGPVSDRSRLLITGIIWTILGGVLGGSAHEPLLGESKGPIISWIGATAWMWCWLTVSIRDGRKRWIERWVGTIVPWFRSIFVVATVVAWTLSVGIVFHQVIGQLFGNALETGASIGWAIGILLVFVRSDAVFPKWRPSIPIIMLNIVPMLSAICGFSAGMVVIERAALRVGLSVNSTSVNASTAYASLIELPVISLITAIAAMIMAAGLIIGFFVGILTVLPSAKWVRSGTNDWKRGWAFGVRFYESVAETFEEYVFLSSGGRLFCDGNGRIDLASRWRQLPISVLLTGALTLGVIAYAVAYLLLAIVAFFGIVTG